MRAQRSVLIVFICLVFGLTATVLVAEQAQDEFSAGEVGAGAKLVVTSVSGPDTALHNQKIRVTYRVKNKGAVASGAYKVGLYLSSDNAIDPAADRLLDVVTFATGLAPGESRKATANVLVPINGLSGDYYYGALVGNNKKASSNQVSLARYSLGDDNDTVTDHKTGLIWQRADDGQQRNWFDANQHCGDLFFGGKADWRLPTVEELFPLADRSRFDPGIDPVFDCRSDEYWSSSISVSNADNAWLVGFQYGNAFWDAKANKYYVRCVRGGTETLPVCTIPGAPTGIVATAGNAQATVSFTAPASNGGGPIISYTVMSNPGGKIVTGTSSPITVTGLTNGIAYTFTVKASNSLCTGPASSPSNTVTPVRYVDLGDGTVTDNRTGLMWQKDDDEGRREWADSASYCECLALGGHDDWRQPRIDELQTIIEYSRINPAIDPAFLASSDNCYWSSSTSVTNPDRAWGVYFYNGEVSHYPKTGYTGNVRCVRNGPFWPFDPSTHLQTPNGKPGTVLDTFWGYMWQKADSETTKTWTEGNAYCDGLDLDGYSDWRLPEIDALQTLINYTTYDPVLSAVFEPSRSSFYWSSSTHSYELGGAWGVHFSAGVTIHNAKASSYYIRCVRGGP